MDHLCTYQCILCIIELQCSVNLSCVHGPELQLEFLQIEYVGGCIFKNVKNLVVAAPYKNSFPPKFASTHFGAGNASFYANLWPNFPHLFNQRCWCVTAGYNVMCYFSFILWSNKACVIVKISNCTRLVIAYCCHLGTIQL